MAIIERYETNPGFEEVLKYYDGAMSIDRFLGTLQEYCDSKGGKKFEIIDTGIPEKFVSGAMSRPSEAIDDALAMREGKLIKLFGKIALNLSFWRYRVNTALLKAYDLGAQALVEYQENGNRSFGIPVRLSADPS